MKPPVKTPYHLKRMQEYSFNILCPSPKRRIFNVPRLEILSETDKMAQKGWDLVSSPNLEYYTKKKFFNLDFVRNE